MAARGADQVVIGHKEHYLRGRDADELAGLLREGAAAVGVHDVPVHATELAGLQALVDQAVPGDVIGVMCHAERGEIAAWLGSAGATADGPDEIRAKVLAAAAPSPPPGPLNRRVARSGRFPARRSAGTRHSTRVQACPQVRSQVSSRYSQSSTELPAPRSNRAGSSSSSRSSAATCSGSSAIAR